MSRDTPVVIVGAGLAGLACAVRAMRAGRRVTLLEASDGVGGRVRTDEVQGFLLDRGFQVLLTAYPAARSHFDYDRLDLREFAPAVRIRWHGAFHDLTDPLQDPTGAVEGLLTRVATTPDKLRLLAWRTRLVTTDGDTLAHAPQDTTLGRLRQRKFSTRFIESFFRPFVSGTFFDPDLETSSRLTELVFRCFFRGAVAVPAGGMQRLPEQLAAALPDGALRLGARVSDVEPGAATTVDGEVHRGVVVVATDGPAATELLGDRIDPPPGRATATFYFDAPTSPVGGPYLVLAADDDGPLTTLAVMSDVAPRYAPPGRSLVSAAVTEPSEQDDDALEAALRAQLRSWYGDQVADWRRLAVYRIPYAQPRMRPEELVTLRRPVRLDDALYVCGDHRDTASIQGALVSGRRTAEAILAAG